MTNGETMMCLLIACGTIASLAAGYCLHMRAVVLDILRSEKKRLQAWADERAERLAEERVTELLRHLRINVPVTLINESGIDWGDGKEKAHDAENENVAA
ncbi:MAG: hypothetical protein IJL32_14170 [Oscillospiraceae bacterium]|nr:hypothetical protein [Oscillospiraceae bacterium]